MSTDHHSNLFLSSLSTESREYLVSRSTAVPLPLRTMLFRAEEGVDHVYFLTSGLASVVSVMEDGAAVEVGMFGREGVVGALQVMGPKPSPMRCFMQLPGDGLRIPISDVRGAFQSSGNIRECLLELVQKEAITLSQIASCHRLHNAEERLSRWLLMVRDRVQSEVLDLTQEYLAEMLGTRRATVTVVAGTLQRSGLIEYHRGRVKILDGKKLEMAACDCYRIIREIWDEL